MEPWYDMALQMTRLVPLHECRELLGDKLFNSILCNPSRKLYSLRPSENECLLNLRNKRAITKRRTHTSRTRNPSLSQ